MENREDKEKKINFGAGPAKIPEAVMQKAWDEFFVYENAGISVLEMSHRSAEFTAIIKETENLIRELMGVPDNFEVLFMQGGGSGQFAAIPLNIKGDKTSADYIVSGTWSNKAFQEGQKYLKARKVYEARVHTGIKHEDEWERNPDAAYLFYCANETVHGIEFSKSPATLPGVPLVADVSSNFLSKPFDFTDHGIVIGGTQKNLGAAGLTIAIVRKDLIGKELPICPTVFSYATMSSNNSVYNTPAVYGIYITNLVLKWIKKQGGVKRLHEVNKAKAQLVYDVINNSNNFYVGPVEKEYRSLMNVVFRIGCPEGDDILEKEFIAGAQAKGMIGLKGHRSVGGIRVSLYNAITMAETQTFVDYMKSFLEQHSKQTNTDTT